MIIRQTALLLLLITFITNGCSYFDLVPRHPTKDKSEFIADKKKCEQLVRSFHEDFPDIYTVNDEIMYIKDCLKDKGWDYLRKNE